MTEHRHWSHTGYTCTPDCPAHWTWTATVGSNGDTEEQA